MGRIHISTFHPTSTGNKSKGNNSSGSDGVSSAAAAHSQAAAAAAAAGAASGGGGGATPAKAKKVITLHGRKFVHFASRIQGYLIHYFPLAFFLGA